MKSPTAQAGCGHGHRPRAGWQQGWRAPREGPAACQVPAQIPSQVQMVFSALFPLPTQDTFFYNVRLLDSAKAQAHASAGKAEQLRGSAGHHSRCHRIRCAPHRSPSPPRRLRPRFPRWLPPLHSRPTLRPTLGPELPPHLGTVLCSHSHVHTSAHREQPVTQECPLFTRRGS